MGPHKSRHNPTFERQDDNEQHVHEEQVDVEMGMRGSQAGSAGEDSQQQQEEHPAEEQQQEYLDASKLLNEVPPHRRVAVSLTNVSAYVPVMPNPDAKDKDGPKERKVLFDNCGFVGPGEVMALMGPSGSGKSTLLQVLGGRSTCRISGDMLFNGKPLTKPVKRKLGFVTQDDLLFGELTVYETLYFSAMLRLPRSWPKERKLERVEMVLTILGLQKCRDTIIGNAQMRGVSGGERKRVSIGAELLINPSVLFLDEPTSGLDSTTALKLVHTMRQLASGGRTIIASIHQPSSRLYQQMDKLMLLSDGYVLYYGHALAAAHWLAMCGHPLPFGVSVPDHILDLANADIPGVPPEHAAAAKKELLDKFRDRKIGCGLHGIQPEDVGGADGTSQASTSSTPHAGMDGKQGHNAHQPNEFSASARAASHDSPSPASTSDDDSALPQRRHYSTIPSSAFEPESDHDHKQHKQHHHHHQQQMSRQEEGEVQKGGQQPPQQQQQPEDQDDERGATWPDQVKYLTIRCMRTRRFAALSIQRIFEILFVAILSGLFWFQAGNPEFQLGQDHITAAIAQDLAGLLFFMLLFMSFSSMFQALFTFPLDMLILIKERQSSMYQLSAYYVAKMLCDFPMDSLIPSLFCWIIYFMSGLRLTAEAFFANWLSILLGMFVAQSLGLLIGATVTNMKTALSMTTVSMLTIMLVAGFYVKDIPIWIRWLKYLSFVFYGYALLLKIEFGHRPYSCDDYYSKYPDAPPGKETCTINEGNIFEIDPDSKFDIDSHVALEVCVLFAFLILLRIAVYVALVEKTSFNKFSLNPFKKCFPNCTVNPFKLCFPNCSLNPLKWFSWMPNPFELLSPSNMKRLVQKSKARK